jgi:hypothetical protein
MKSGKRESEKRKRRVRWRSAEEKFDSALKQPNTKNPQRSL